MKLFPLASVFLLTLATAFAEDSFSVSVNVDAGKSSGPLKPIWRFFGADEPNYATMKDGRKLLGELGELDKGNVFFRTHNLLTTGDGKAAIKWGSTNAYTEDADGNPVYDWTILDEIFDAYLENGVRPYAQIGFMPKALSIKPEPYEHHWKPGDPYEEIFTGWAYPPKDYDKWEELVYQWVKHCVDKYGREEVETWYWETWNESNAGYWQGTTEEFFKLHDYAIAGVRRALPTAKVGGPDTAGAGGRFMDEFLEHCLNGTNFATGERGTPLDFLSFHAKGAPEFVDGHVRMGISNQLREYDRAFKRFASFPELKSKPIVVGESDPDGCAACSAELYPQNDYRNGTLYASYTAASFARKHDLADRHGVNLEGALTWAFEFEDEPWFAGFRVLATNGVDLPVMNVFRMMAMMTGDRIAAESDHEIPLDEIMRDGVRKQPDVGALASRDGDKISVMVWHYHDDEVPGESAEVKISLSGLADGPWNVRQFRVDETHSNAFTVWKKMGSPATPDAEQIRTMEAAGQLEEFEAPTRLEARDGTTRTSVLLPRQSVALLELTPVD